MSCICVADLLFSSFILQTEFITKKVFIFPKKYQKDPAPPTCGLEMTEAEQEPSRNLVTCLSHTRNKSTLK